MTDVQETDETPIVVSAPKAVKTTPTKRGRATTKRRAAPKRNVLQQESPAYDARPVNVSQTRRSRGRVDGKRRRLPNIQLPPDWVGHWFVDDDGDPDKGTAGSRIEQAFKEDWNFVRMSADEKGKYEITGDDLGTNMSVVANRNSGGAKCYFMAKRREMYDEDRAGGVDKINDEIDEALSPDRALKAVAAGDDPHFHNANRDR
jgi:hypothetical protein